MRRIKKKEDSVKQQRRLDFVKQQRRLDSVKQQRRLDFVKQPNLEWRKLVVCPWIRSWVG
jgi:hypothetical protein